MTSIPSTSEDAIMDKWEYAVLTITRVQHEEPGGRFKSPRLTKRHIADLEYGPDKNERHIANTFIGALNWAGHKGWRATGDGERRAVFDADRQRLRAHGQVETIRRLHLVRRIG
jgi:hypothetical protein